jgi:hypothetical protein
LGAFCKEICLNFHIPSSIHPTGSMSCTRSRTTSLNREPPPYCSSAARRCCPCSRSDSAINSSRVLVLRNRTSSFKTPDSSAKVVAIPASRISSTGRACSWHLFSQRGWLAPVATRKRRGACAPQCRSALHAPNRLPTPDSRLPTPDSIPATANTSSPLPPSGPTATACAASPPPVLSRKGLPSVGPPAVPSASGSFQTTTTKSRIPASPRHSNPGTHPNPPVNLPQGLRSWAQCSPEQNYCKKKMRRKKCAERNDIPPLV